MTIGIDEGSPQRDPASWVARTRSFLAAGESGGAIVVWIATRLSIYTAAWYASWALAGPPNILQGAGVVPGPQSSFIDLWDRWDAMHFQSIAGPGYGSVNFETNYAFFPGFPLATRLVAITGVDLTTAGLVVSFVAGLFAALALARLTADVGGDARLGVLAWAIAPAALFLAAPYSETMFCAFAFWAWVFVRRGAWVWAGTLGFLASLTRVNGLFLGVAMLVAFVVSKPRQWSRLPALAGPFIGVGVVFAYYYSLTGSWTTWSDSMRVGWGRSGLMNPVESYVRIYEWAYDWQLAAPWVVQYRFEIIWTFLIAMAGIVLLLKRWYGEATFILVTTASLVTTVWGSVPRYTLVLFPLWMLMGLWMTNHRVVRVLYVSIAAPLMIASVVVWVNGYWVS